MKTRKSKEVGPKRGALRKTYSLAHPFRIQIAILVISSFLTGTVEALFLVLVTRAALNVVDGTNPPVSLGGYEFSVEVILVITMILVLVRLWFSVISASSSASLISRVGLGMRRNLSRSYLSASWAAHQKEPSGRLLQLVSSFVNQAVGAITALTLMLNMGLNLIAMVVVSLAVDPIASLAVLATVSFLALVLAPLQRRIRGRAILSTEAQKSYARSISELDQLGLEMQTLGVTQEFIDQVDELSEEMASKDERVLLLRGVLPHLFVTLAFLSLSGGMLIVASIGLDDLSAIGPVMLIMLRSLSFGQQLQVAFGQLAGSSPFLDEIEHSRSRYEQSRATNGRDEILRFGSVEVENLSFEYESGRATLSGISFSIDPGQIVGVVGSSGSGKTTLIQLLLGLREPNGGSLTVGGIPLGQIDRRNWAKVSSYVPQEPRLVSGTVAENIRFFRKGLSPTSLLLAAKKAHILEEVVALPHGFNTNLGERGAQLSGGQRQRLSIARALVGNPEFLVLDEPTSALDSYSESMIRATLEDLRGIVTVVVVTHRLSTLEVCDKILEIEKGRLKSIRTPEELRTQGAFHEEAIGPSKLT